MELYDPQNDYTKAILTREKPIKQLRKIADRPDINSRPPGEISILVSSLEDKDFNFIQGPLNKIITRTTLEVVREIIKFIPPKRLIHYTASISARLGEVIDLINPSEFKLFMKAANKEIAANNNAAKIIKYIVQNNNVDLFNKAITKAILSSNEHDLEQILQVIPSEKIVNFIDPVSDAIIRIGNSNIIHALSKGPIEIFVRPIGERMINLVPTDIKCGISTDLLSLIKAIPATKTCHFIEHIGISISILKDILTKTLTERYIGGLTRNCDRYINTILAHVPDEHHQSILDITARPLLSDTKQYPRSRTSFSSWTEYVTHQTSNKSISTQPPNFN